MRDAESMKLARRNFLKSVAAVTGTGPLMPELMTGLAAARTVAAVGARAQQRSEASSAEKQSSYALGYESLGPDEVDFVEAMVNVICSGDDLTPNGVDCGLATFIAANEAAREKLGISFSELTPADADAFLHELAAGHRARRASPARLLVQ